MRPLFHSLILTLLSIINAIAKPSTPSLHIITLYGPPPTSQSPTHIHFPPTENVSFYQYKHSFLIMKALPKTEFSISRHSKNKRHSSKDIYPASSSSSSPIVIKLYQGSLFINYDNNELPYLHIHTHNARYSLTDQPAQYIVTPQSVIKVIPSPSKVRQVFAPCYTALKLLNTNQLKITPSKESN